MWHVNYKILFTNICSNYHPLTFACKTSSRVILVINTNAKLTLLRWSIPESGIKCNLGSIWDYIESRRDSEFNTYFLTFSSNVRGVPIINNIFSQRFFPTCCSKLSVQTWSCAVANLNHWTRHVTDFRGHWMTARCSPVKTSKSNKSGHSEENVLLILTFHTQMMFNKSHHWCLLTSVLFS